MATLLRGFSNFFNKHPLAGNGLVYGSLYVGAEFSQQTITRKFLTDPPQDLDKPTLGRYAIMGTFIYSPILYNWYKWLDKTFPGTARRIIVRKLLLDQFILTPPLLVIFFTGMSLMERQSNIMEECKQKFVPTFARSCLFWMPAQTVNFLLVPPKFRVVYVGSCALAWVNILCWVKRQKMTAKSSETH
ncbi:mpv17-like protein [Toxorhynchites rutilus septentrionalis]|uniref:mpv17-like protein n=1 Tax=Toxorhynchites rutilus septentrionalis TaxID=329112 RepID=UPI00247AFED3|nr:mpv17-like protein [Toxorhynchites rutilus septentrionalis]